MKKNIVLIGMPGVGKSTVGVILAKIAGLKFTDSDLCIQEREGRLLKDIIAIDGVDRFIEIEGEVLSSLKVDSSVIATGGSAVYSAAAMEKLKESGTVIYLKLSFDSLRERLHDIKGRGVVLRDGQTLEDLYKERIPLYEKFADITVTEDGLTPEETVNAIETKLNNLRQDC